MELSHVFIREIEVNSELSPNTVLKLPYVRHILKATSNVFLSKSHAGRPNTH